MRRRRAVALAVAAPVFLLIAFRTVIRAVRVQGSSMEPTLQDGQGLFVIATGYGRLLRPRFGDVVLFRRAAGRGGMGIKRIVGLPGQKIEIRGPRLYVDGRQVREPYPVRPGSYDWGPDVVPPGHYFVLGDNRDAARDSHTGGYLPGDRIIGKLWLRYSPADVFGPLPSA